MSDLSKHINIGKDTEAKLISLGIENFEQLVSVGTEQAFLRLRALDPGACIQLLYGLDGAIQNIKDTKLPPERKEELKHFHRMLNK